MVCLQLRKMPVLALAAAGVLCLTAAKTMVAAAPNVTYTATGIFASPPISGDDLFQLQGEPFTISVVANAATAPTAHGPHWAKYTKLKMTGTVTSGLEPTPLTIQSGLTSIELATGNPSYDVFDLFAPVNVIGLQINVLAAIRMPSGTITNALIHPFASITIGGTGDSMTYSDPTTGSSTTLGVASGTLVATIPGGADVDGAVAPDSVQLHLGGAQTITAHADGTKSMRTVGTAPIDLGGSADAVALQFYTSGLHGGSDIHVQIAGHDVPVLYAGPAGHFPGLDQVSVKIPRSLAGSGDVAVALTVDGRTSNSLHIQIQ